MSESGGAGSGASGQGNAGNDNKNPKSNEKDDKVEVSAHMREGYRVRAYVRNRPGQGESPDKDDNRDKDNAARDIIDQKTVLHELGYYKAESHSEPGGQFHGYANDNLTSAITKFQEARGIPATGRMNDLTRDALFGKGTDGMKTNDNGMEFTIRGQDKHGNGAFGTSRDGGTRKHNGVDIVKQPGEPVYAVTDGKYADPTQVYLPSTVQNSPKLAGYTYVNTKDNNGNDVKYGYVDAIPGLNKGDQIKKGDLIGHMQDRAKVSPGMTNHLHFEVKKGEEILNPIDYLISKGHKFK